jgi:hypothetical protein
MKKMNRQQILNEQAALKLKLKYLTPREYVSKMTKLRSELSIIEKQMCDDYDRVILENNRLKLENVKLKTKYNSVGKPWSYNEDLQLIEEYKSGTNISEICKNHKRNIGGISCRLAKYNLKGTEQRNEIYQDVNEIKSSIKELKEMFTALYEFETT